MRLVRIIVALLAFALVAPVMAEDVTFAGLVTYRERMALPADAALTITLVSLSGESRITGAHASLGGKSGSPIQFTLNVRSDVIAAGSQYGLVAEIWSAGYVIFRNRQPVVVDAAEPEGNIIEVEFSPPPPHEAPEQVLPPETPIPLLDTAWRVIGIGGDPVLADTEVTLSIAADHRAGGNGGCNSYFTEADFEGPPSLSFGPIAGTRMACTPEVMVQEADLFAALGATVGYELAGNSLVLVDAAGVPLIELVREQ